MEHIMEQCTIYVVTVIKDDGTTRTEKFSNKENLERWLKYMKETSSAKCEVTEREAKGLFDIITTYEGKWFPTGRETEDSIELAPGIKLGLTTGTWIPNPNPTKVVWRPKAK